MSGIDLKPRFPAVDTLECDALALAQILARTSLLPSPDVVSQFDGPVFASIRANKATGGRGSLFETDTGRYLLDDNTTPRWALLVSHGFRPNLPSSKRGWSFAHVWSRPQCPASYTQLANLCMVAEPLSSLTDKASPIAGYFRYHAWATYGWMPPNIAEPHKPEGYDLIQWQYFSSVPDAKMRIKEFLQASSNTWVAKLRTLTKFG